MLFGRGVMGEWVRSSPMPRRIWQLGALITFAAGCVFALQGLRLLPSPLMYGKPEWVVIGAVMVLASVIVVIRSALR